MGTLLSKPTLILGLIVLGLFFLWGISRQWSCRPVKPPRPTRWDEYDVISCDSGVSMTVKAGLAGRRTRTVMLLGCVSPSSPDLAEASRASLEALAGGSVRVQHHGILGTNPTQQEAPEARGPIVAEVFAVASGANLAESQLSAGWVRATEGASKEYRALEAKAHKAQIGQWKEIE